MADDKDVNPEVEADIHFQPIIHLPKVHVKTLEDDEDEIFKMRAKLFRFDSVAQPPEWKERGLGDIRMLKHKTTGQVRLLMRREKTFKICCNHYITPVMKLKPHAGSQKAFVWTTLADFADEEIKQELFAIRFKDGECAEKFKIKFEESQHQDNAAVIEETKENDNPSQDEKNESENVTEKLEQLQVKSDE